MLGKKKLYKTTKQSINIKQIKKSNRQKEVGRKEQYKIRSLFQNSKGSFKFFI
jgi:hypothetical protein